MGQISSDNLVLEDFDVNFDEYILKYIEVYNENHTNITFSHYNRSDNFEEFIEKFILRLY